MSKLVSIVQAAQNALAAYLTNAINNPKFGSKPATLTVVEPRWPDPKKLPAKAITIIPAGPRTDGTDPVLGWWHYSTKVDPQPPDLPTGQVMWRWTVGWYEQPVQLDIWCRYDIDRDDLIARLDIALHTGQGELTKGQPGSHDPITDYLVIPLAQEDGWLGAYCDAYFGEDGPTITDTATAAGQTLYRATWRGTLEVLLTVDDVSPIMARNKFKIRMSETQVPTTGSYDVQITVSDSGTSWSSGVP